MKRKAELTPSKNRGAGKAVRFLVLILFAAGILFLLSRKLWDGCAIPQYAGSHGYREASWVYSRGDTVLEPELSTPAFRRMETGESYSISTTLTYDGSADRLPSCFFFVDHMHCRATLDGQVLFSYMPGEAQKPDASKSPGNVYAVFQLPRDCLGKQLVIEFIPSLDADIEYQLPNPVFGNYFTESVHTFVGDLPHNVIAVLAAFLGIMSILFSTLALSGSKYREGIFIGVFATLFSLYNITESDFNFYLISNPYYTYVLDYTTFTLIPIFFIAFLRERLDARQRSIATAMIVIGVMMFVTEMVLHFTGIMDMREYLPLLHIVYFADFVFIFILLLTMEKNRWRQQLVLQMIPMMLGMVLDAAVYYKHWQLDSSDSTFTSIGVLIFLIAELYHVWKYSVEVYTESIRSQDYRQMAYVDALTGIGNRRAFDVERDNVATGQTKFRSLIVASIDVNDLKLTNDTYGHAAGDFLIRNAANVLSDLAEHFGHAFRVGGDEFIVILYDMDPEEFELRLSRMQEQIDAINSKSETKLSLALGYELCKGNHLQAALENADRKMYRIKAQSKKEQPETEQ